MTYLKADAPDLDDPIALARFLIGECERRSIAAWAHQGPALRAQGLNAELFRARQQLELAEFAASENLARLVDSQYGFAAEVARLQEHHQSELTTAAQALQRSEIEVAALKNELTTAGQALQRSEIEAAGLKLTMAELQALATETSTLLAHVLSSRSWTMTRPMRRLIERVRGRRWQEPRLPQLPN